MLARRGLAALATRRAASAPRVGRAVLPQVSQSFQQTLINGAVSASATSERGLSLDHLIVEPNAADSLQARMNDVLAWTPLEALPVSAATLPEWRVVLVLPACRRALSPIPLSRSRLAREV